MNPFADNIKDLLEVHKGYMEGYNQAIQDIKAKLEAKKYEDK